MTEPSDPSEIPYDLLVIGAGINGAGLARDAAGRGLKVLIIDQGDIAGATSSASTKLIHGGLRYLEHLDIGLVRESLAERETLRAIVPHLAREQRFLIPHAPGQRPRWMIRLGLGLYDALARGSTLPRAAAVSLRDSPLGAPLRPDFTHGFVYSDLATDDARLTLLNVVSAAQLGARVLTRTRLQAVQRQGSLWQVTLAPPAGTPAHCRARILVNAAGPWVPEVRRLATGSGGPPALKLVKGSHLVLPRLYAGDHACLLQNADGRIAFILPFEKDFSLLGTTEVLLDAPQEKPMIEPAEADYLCALANRFLRTPVTPGQAVWSFAGIRALYDDGRGSVSAVSREYHLHIDGSWREAPLLSIFGGKLTTYRHLAERVLAELKPWLPGLRPAWTAHVHLPGGGLGPGGLNGLLQALVQRYADLPVELLDALARRHGTLATRILGAARREADLGEYFGGGLYAAEVDHLVAHEWARSAGDILWRRTKCGLRCTSEEKNRLAAYLERKALS